MNLEEVQNYFKEQIALGNYEVTDKYQASFGYKKLWVSVLVDNRPFVIEITLKGKVEQIGDITENYLQLGTFSNNQYFQLGRTGTTKYQITDYSLLKFNVNLKINKLICNSLKSNSSSGP